MIQCAKCKADIPDDSHFCDQCGEQLMFCPKCADGKPRKGKRCTQCGTVLVDRNHLSGPALNTCQPSGQYPSPYQVGQQHSPNQSGQNTVPQSQHRDTVQQGTQQQFDQSGHDGTLRPTPQGPTRMVKVDNPSVVVVFKDGGIIGRKTGDYLSVFADNGYTSGRHARIDKATTGWTITDLGSTNGTKIDGSRITPNSPVALKNGNIIEIGYVKFKVE